jgi:hypothetical protein
MRYHGGACATPEGNTLALFGVPHVFAQEELMRIDEFSKEAKKWGEEVIAADVRRLIRRGLLVPYFRIDDSASPSRTLPIPVDDYDYVSGYARDGRLFDPLAEGYPLITDSESEVYPYDYLLSRWQILGLRHAMSSDFSADGGYTSGELRKTAWKYRRESMALSALSGRYLPRILGHASIPVRLSLDDYLDGQNETDVSTRLRCGSFNPSELYKTASALLSSASTDPMKEWWPLIRHSDHRGWSKMFGPSRYALEQRIAAELLLLAHDELVAEGAISAVPFPNPEGRFWNPIFDRLGAKGEHVDSLDRALANLGLSPKPSVVVLLEGETEDIHIAKLLAHIGLENPNTVQRVVMGGSNKNPEVIARYVVKPRVGPVRRGRRVVDAPPTAVFVAMDPENHWKTPEKVEEHRKALSSEIRREIEREGARITDLELDALVSIRVWGEETYELANFTDDELIDAIISTAPESGDIGPNRTRIREAVEHSRRSKSRDIGVALQRLGRPRLKVILAQALLSVLLAKFDAEVDADKVVTPVVQLILDINDKVVNFSHGSFYFEEV